MMAKKLWYVFASVYILLFLIIGLWREPDILKVASLVIVLVGSWLSVIQFVFLEKMRFSSFNLGRERVFLRWFFFLIALSILLFMPYYLYSLLIAK